MTKNNTVKQLRLLPEDPKLNYWEQKRIPESHEGELVYCKKNTLKDFQINKVYKIKKIVKHYWTFKVKIDGVKGYHSWSSFDFIENNPALFRDYQINQVMDLETVITTTIEGRKIDTMPNKEFVLAQMLIYSLNKKTGHVGEKPQSVGYNSFIANLVKKYSKYGINEDDLKAITEMPLKDVINLFDY